MLTMRSVDREGFGKKKRAWNSELQLQLTGKHGLNTANQALERPVMQSALTTAA